MSVELFVDGRPRGQIASNGGFARFEHELGLAQVRGAVSEFLIRGWSDDITKLADDLRELDEGTPMSEESRGVLRNLIEALPDKGTISVSME